ncbi:hypothetical protein HD806DRAFT_535536 [Xylariaceae sp. AK1471]|nr:hypothetical protein HD806DRAFT_535536 [Xylariaceae sp. AK1471]
MTPVGPDKSNEQAPNIRKRPRDGPKPNTKPKKRKPKPASDHSQGWFSIHDIIDEKVENGRIKYLIDWDGIDKNGRRYDPTWEPAANVTKVAINAWRDKKNDEAPKATDAPGHDKDSRPLESTQDTDPAQALNWRREKRKIKPRDFDSTLGRSYNNTEEEEHKRRQAEGSYVRVSRAESKHQSIPFSGCLYTGNSEVHELAQAGPVVGIKGAQIVVELPGVSTFDPSEFQVIPPSQTSQQSSQSTLPERRHPGGLTVRDQRIIPDSQEISSTSASEHNSYPDSVDLLVESQVSKDPLAPRKPVENLLQASSSGIPSHQPDPRFVGISGLSINPNISTNSAVNSVTNQNHSVLHTTSTGPSQGPVTGLSPVFQTQPSFDWDIAVATSPATISHNGIIPASLRQHLGTQTVQETESQHSHITNRASTPTNSQAAQIIQPLSSHPGGATFHSQSFFSVFAEDSTVPETVPRQREAQVDSQDSSQALSELDGNIRVSSTATKGHEADSSAVLPHESQSATQRSEEPNLRCDTIELSQQSRLVTPDMDGTSAAATPESFQEKMRRIREQHFGRSSVVGTISPATPSPVPLDIVSHVAFNSMPQAAAHIDGENAPTVDTPASLISPMVLLPSAEATRALDMTEPSFEAAQAPIDTNLPHEHILADAVPLHAYDAPLIEQPATLNPSALTLSIENDVDGSPSIPTDDGFASGPPPPRSIDSDEEEMQADYPRGLLPHVPTGPSEYLITLPFQTSSRPQYNDIIRENEALIHEYNASFRVFPHETPKKDIVEKLDIMFSRLFDICDFPPFLDSLASMSAEQITKHVIATNAKFSFVDELLDELQALNSDKKILILVRPGKLMDLLDHVIQSRGYHYIRSGQEIISEADTGDLLTVALCSTTDEESSIPKNFDVIIAFDHTFRQELVSPMDHTISPIILALVTTASIQHLNMRIMENLQPLERKNVLMLALVKAMRFIEEPDPSISLFSIVEKFTRRIQMPDDEEDDFYWEPQSLPTEIFGDLYAASSQIEATQFSATSLGADQLPGSRKRSHIEDDGDESLPKRPKMSQPQVVTALNHVSDALRSLLGDGLTKDAEKATVVVSVDKLEALSAKLAEMEPKLKESKARENEFRQLCDRAQKEVNSYASSINKIQTRYMEALKERGIFEAECKTAREEASGLGRSLESRQTEIATLKATRTELEKKLTEANDALLHSSNPNLIKMAQLEKDLNAANAQVQRLDKRVAVMQSDTDYSKNMYNTASQRGSELASENRGYEKQIEQLQRKADANIIEVNRVQARNEVRALAQQVKELKNVARERDAELNRIREELKALKSGRRETRQSSVPRSPRLNSLGVMSPRNGTRGPSAMGGPSSSRGTSPAPPTGVFDMPASSGNGAQNTTAFTQGPGANRISHLRDQRF